MYSPGRTLTCFPGDFVCMTGFSSCLLVFFPWTTKGSEGQRGPAGLRVSFSPVLVWQNMNCLLESHRIHGLLFHTFGFVLSRVRKAIEEQPETRFEINQ